MSVIGSVQNPSSGVPGFEDKPYVQVFSDRFGFVPGLSIIDLLFNAGPEARGILGAGVAVRNGGSKPEADRKDHVIAVIAVERSAVDLFGIHVISLLFG